MLERNTSRSEQDLVSRSKIETEIGEIKLCFRIEHREGSAIHFSLQGPGDEEKILFAGIISETGGRAVLDHLRLDREESMPRRAGIATEVMRKLEDCLRSAGIASLYTFFYKPDTLKFLKAQGFRVVQASSVEEEQIQDFGSTEYTSGFRGGVMSEREFKKLLRKKRKENLIPRRALLFKTLV